MKRFMLLHFGFEKPIPDVHIGYHPERKVQMGIDPVAVRIPKTRDRSGSGIKNRI